MTKETKWPRIVEILPLTKNGGHQNNGNARFQTWSIWSFL